VFCDETPRSSPAFESRTKCPMKDFNKEFCKSMRIITVLCDGYDCFLLGHTARNSSIERHCKKEADVRKVTQTYEEDHSPPHGARFTKALTGN